MFDFFRGQIATKAPTRLVLDVGGVGYLFEVPLSTSEALPEKGEARVWAHHHVREDVQKLYGFHTRTERDLFVMLQKVNGVGPSIALALLSRARVGEICDAILQGRVDFLRSLKGVGPKTAQRLITELKDQIGAVAWSDGAARAAAAGSDAPPAGEIERDAVQALEVLGCPTKAAQQAVKKALDDGAPREVAGLVRAGLKIVWPS